jgi:hypothetical protein
MQAFTLKKNENKGSQMGHTKKKSFVASTKNLNFSKTERQLIKNK